MSNATIQQRLTAVRLFYDHLVFEAARRRGYRSLGLTWIGDDNGPSLKSISGLGFQPWHRVFMYERAP